MQKKKSCVETLRQHPSLVQTLLEEQGKKKRKLENCVNKVSVSGYPLDQMWMKDEPFHKSKTDPSFCLTPEQYLFLYGNSNTSHFVAPNPKGYPLKELLKPTACWIHSQQKRRLDVFNRSYAFLYCDFPMEWDKMKDGSPFKNITPYKFTSTLEFSQLFHLNSFFVYLFHFRNPLVLQSENKLNYPTKYYANDIQSIQLLGQQFQSLVRPMTYDSEVFQRVKNILFKYMQGRSLSISLSDIKLIRSFRLKLPHPITAFRALLVKENEVKSLSLLNLKKGQSYHYHAKNAQQVSSWTTDLCVAQYFATHSIMMGHSNKSSTVRFGIIFKAVLDPSEILIDTRLLKIDDLCHLRSKSQSEIIVDRMPKTKYINCEIEELWMQRNGYILPVQQFSTILQWIKESK